jgi:hypothetical protein
MNKDIISAIETLPISLHQDRINVLSMFVRVSEDRRSPDFFFKYLQHSCHQLRSHFRNKFKFHA